MTQDKQQETPIITLAQFLKWKGLVGTGGEAKHRIQQGEVLVDGLIETRRGRKLTSGNEVTIDGVTYQVEL
jgi:ribosome-associated protein